MIFSPEFKYPKIFLLAISAFLLISIVLLLSVNISRDKSVDLESQVNPSPQVAAGETEVENVVANVQNNDKEPETADLRSEKMKVGIVVNDYENKLGTIPFLEERLSTKFSTVSIYLQFGNNFNNLLSTKDLSYVLSSGKKLMIALEPWNPDEGLNQSTDFLLEIVNGQQDNYLRKLAEEVINYGGPVVIRFGHEMNGNWYPWGQKPEEYKDAYRKVVDIFRGAGVTNVLWMWNINAESVPSESVSQVVKYYPGDDYVDLLGIDGFNFGTGTSGWRSFSAIFSPAYNYLNSIYSKPIIIAETASSEEGGSKAEWISAMFGTLNGGFINVTEMVWFNLLKEADWRIESTDNSLNSFRQGVNNP